MQKETSGATAGLASCRIGARDPPEPRILLDLEPVRVHVVDPSAYTPPYDRALCAALARRPGLDVTLVTSPFRHGEVPPAVGFAVDERFYRRLPRRGPDAVRLAAKLARHPADMLRYRARGADLVHFQWLTVQHLDRFLLPRGRPRVLTAHDVLPREPRPGQRGAQRRLYGAMDAVVVHSEHGAQRLRAELGLPPERVHVIPHGAFTHLTGLAPRLPPELPAAGPPVVLLFGLLRPYKGLDVLLEAWRGIRAEAELWVVGAPRMALPAMPPGARLVPRFVADAEAAAVLRRAAVLVLPYREIDQSGVLFAGLGLGKAMVLSDVGGFPELGPAAAHVPAGDPEALRAELERLLGDPAARAGLEAAAARAAAGPHSWDDVALRHHALYRGLAGA
jgi:glycosyltransferase involved in cell wall biosynthesis